MKLRVSGSWFLDEKNRKVLLRGVNLGGSSKVPTTPNGATHIRSDFADHRDVSFIGRPFSLEEADGHFTRLSRWGFNCLRLLTTWEAIEHAGPKQYDTNYLDYFAKIVEMAGDYGFYVYVDPHQDVWSRMTGGDGAPGWVFGKVGLDFTKFAASDASIIMQAHYPDNYPAMMWSQNYARFAASTMFTLFFGGERFAPNLQIDGKNVQTYLQEHYMSAISQVANKIKNLENVIGFGPLNEPSKGLIGYPDIRKPPAFKFPGMMFSPLEMMYAAAGNSVEVPIYKVKLFRIRPSDRGILNPNAISVWKDGAEDIWQIHNVWENTNNGVTTKNPYYFSKDENGKSIEFFNEFLVPFMEQYAEMIRAQIPDATIFLEGDIVAVSDPIQWTDNSMKNLVNATHWYDGYTLFTKQFRPWLNVNVENLRPVLGQKRIMNMFYRQLNRIKTESKAIQGGVPTLIGEFGIPYDMNGKKAFRTGNFKMQAKALSMYYDVFDQLQLHSTIWNYTSDNCNQWGDLWNLEDLSIFSIDQQTNPSNIDSGGRAIRGFSRPYPIRTTGQPLSWNFKQNQKKFTFQYLPDSTSSEVATEIYIPPIHFHKGIKVELAHGHFHFDQANNILNIMTSSSSRQVVVITSQ